MSRWSRILSCALACALGPALGLTAGATARADEQPFYSGKTITFVVALGPGSGADTDCRMLANYIGRHIDGNPTVIVRNMPSTDKVPALNYVGDEARKDGQTVLCGPFAPDQQLFHNSALHVDLTRFNYITGDGSPDVAYMRTDVEPGMKTGQDIFKAAPDSVVLGGFAPDSLKDIYLRSLFATLGVQDYKYVTGFTGGAQARAALQQKFINVWSENVTGYTQLVAPALVKTGTVVPLFQTGELDSIKVPSGRSTLLPDVPSFVDFYKAHFGKNPSGSAWELSKLILGMDDVALRAVALPPGSPPAAVKALRDAVAPLNHDPEFVARSDKLRGPDSLEQPPEMVEGQIDSFLGMKMSLVSYYKGLIDGGEMMVSRN